MAKTSAADAAAVKQLKSDLSAGTLGRLYLFHGEEAYLRDFYLGQMKKKLLSGGMEAFNLHTLQARECDPKSLGQIVDCLPMMSQRTMVVVYDYDLFKAPAEQRETMAALFADLPEYVCLVFVYDLIEYKPDARTKLAAAIKANGTAVKFTRQEQGDLVDWIRRRFKALDHDIDSELARYLIFLCGDLMTGLISEIGKIGAYARHRAVTRADIDAVAIPQLDAVVFQLTDAITAGDFDKAVSVLSDLLHMGSPPSSSSRCWGGSSGSSTPPGWPWRSGRGRAIWWSCGACARPTRPRSSWTPPGGSTGAGAGGRWSRRRRPI